MLTTGARLAGLLLVALLGGCAADAAPTAPTPARAPDTSSFPARPPAPTGLTVRYLDADGRIATIPVEHFRR